MIPALSQTGRAFHYHDRGPETSTDFRPADLGIEQPVRAPRIPGSNDDDQSESALDTAAIAEAAAKAGLAALDGQPGPTRDSLVIGAALCLWHLKRHDSLESAAHAVRGVLDSGRASERVRHQRC